MKLTQLIVLLMLLMSTMLWSADEVIINEIMYNSSGTDVEFVELYNKSSASVSLAGWYILDDNDSHSHCLLGGNLAAGAYLVIAGNLSLFHTTYPNVSNINTNDFDSGTDAWSLGNSGDAVRLFNSSNQLQDIVEYSDGGSWPGSADGDGPSLELLNPALDNSLPTSWDPSVAYGGTPGAVNSVLTDNVQPVCKDGHRNIDLPESSDEVIVSVLAFDPEELLKVELMLNTGSGYSAVLMNDNGTGSDAVAGDSIFSAAIPAQSNSTLVKYYAVATDNVSQIDTWPNEAPQNYHAYTVGYKPPKLRVTEVLAINDHVITDGAGEYDDWFEIHNEDNITVNIAGMFVSNSLGNSREFQLPSRNLVPDEYLLIWADNDEDQGSLHANFKLSSSGEDVALFESIDHGNVLIHGWKYGVMSPDISMGFIPGNANAPEYLRNPTPNDSNEDSDIYSDICINEFQTTSNFGGPQDDWVEVYNRGSVAFNLSGCFLSDERSNNTKWTFPANTILEPGAFLTVYEDVLGFGFSSEGDDVIMLTSADSTTGLDFFDFGPQLPDHSQGRYPDGSSFWAFFNTPTKSESNTNPSTINDNQETLPEKINLHANYPNPFNSQTTVIFSLPKATWIRLVVYDISGREVDILKDNIGSSGINRIIFSADHLSAGLYFYCLTAGDFSQTRKMLLIK
ncbi:lamin tail domain-containing protein [bacterium]|nr:lamin tail domain-containing protein [bacterium]MBU1064038.1 lamin tail domain-containing protein [bacterium]MBU1635410.1 lamin tail domain-containing protein [bacterium]MBU1872311.1 lamin tail domain-containing protein [bacterium]